MWSSKWFWTQTLNTSSLITDNLNHQLLWTIIFLNLFFCVIENESLQCLLWMLQSEISSQLLSQTKLCDLLNKKHERIMNNLLINYESTIKVSLAVDDWNSSNHLAFLEINCYYIDWNLQYQKKLLEFKSVSDSHTGQKLAEIVESVLIKHKLETHFLAVTTDNADNNDMMWTELKDVLNWLHDVIWDKKVGIISCLTHIIQLIEKMLITLLKIVMINKTFSTSFNENDISKTMQMTEFFSNIFQKIYF